MPAGSLMDTIRRRGYLIAGVDQNSLLLAYFNPMHRTIEGFEKREPQSEIAIRQLEQRGYFQGIREQGKRNDLRSCDIRWAGYRAPLVLGDRRCREQFPGGCAYECRRHKAGR